MPKDVNEQMEILLRGTVDIVSKGELIKKIDRSMQEKRPLRVKLGLDPTAPDIHIGNAIPIHKLRAFQSLGHTAILIIGDYTAVVGDPSGVNKTRPMITHDKVLENAKTYLTQAGKILDMDKTEVVYNSKWFKSMTFNDVIQLVSKMTVARMMERDDFSKRYKAGSPISLHEFIYPLMQGYDSIMVKNDVELGGTDQLFSLLVGRDLQKDAGMEPQVVLTTSLLEGIDGNKKMSKSLNNYIGITEPPREMFGKVMSIPDNLMRKYFELATDVSIEDIQQLLDEKTHPRTAKVALAKAIVTRYHNLQAAEAAAEEFDRVFKEGALPDEIPIISIPDGELENGKIWITKLIVSCKFAATNGEARRLIQQGGVSVNSETINDPTLNIEITPGMTLKVGKRRFAKIVLQ
ncbi:MAG: tyrosine--tRNA ligase [Candidatus Kuenenia stuttgartiensis]|uniref:Tyrosine--tRNA ligase n=2 Tax=Candidatus Kuenenia TaxID=380738 RepID=A0A2C9CEV0_KUEST|nr:tyrosine--tRNA ligase [Candidatus Kuenenia stuttgartiensis]MBW7941511.1 tyrosine--tRNA ligase [Candidatus Kuenenia stuttgartiensis]MBZ0191026.1 tyrosine--tRNA ligase [Candidatus Kuenenia stuttgartiensis]MCF6151231.1 tyrosine--tRNA ligase [Candidatus Kuenenia stuttgartiensis]MCL4726029.1 tyrosine--tRNA ligase [Candidatus Kuenenia stuttgartiensis]SOH04108.1 strongly similar to tyrosyl-tRNA ligase [Candidatus Kuenenia stuttgartiensis]